MLFRHDTNLADTVWKHPYKGFRIDPSTYYIIKDYVTKYYTKLHEKHYIIQHYDEIDGIICYSKLTLQISIYGCFGEINGLSGLLIFNKCSNSKENNAEFINLLTNSFMRIFIYGFNDNILSF